MTRLKDAVLAVAAMFGSALSAALGGWDAALQTLVVCMALDYLSGVVVAGVFKCSEKSSDGALDSRAGFRGLCKKGAELALVLVGARLDYLLGGDWARTAVILFFIGNEGLSILENLGLRGVPYPAFLREALDVLKEQNDRGQSDHET